MAVSVGILVVLWGTAARPPASAHARRSSLVAIVPAIPVSIVATTKPNGATITPPTCISPAGATFTCYSPALIQQAYDFPTGAGAPTGRGQTIVLVVAFGDPAIRNDLAAFDAQWSLPAPPSFEIVGPTSTGDPSDPDVQQWQHETALDVEWAHALAPAARIVLVVSATDDDTVMNDAEGAALPLFPGAIVSHSFGSAETDDVPANVALHRIFVRAQRLGDTLVAGAGDFGATDGTDRATASYPASDPLVTAVGGTEGLPYPDGLWRRGRYGKEQVWNEGDTFDLATGGAPSVLFPGRLTPDVAFDAAINGGVLVVVNGTTTLMGGTSVGSPCWAAIFALANERRGRGIGFANPALYALALDSRHNTDFHDITVGDNALDSRIGFRARGGYDLATGLGTPDVTVLLADLVGSSGGPGADPGEPKGRGEGNGRTDRHPGR